MEFRSKLLYFPPVRFGSLSLVLSACLAQPLAGQATDSLALARRVVAAASLAAKEYALGVVPAGGQITQPEEVDEARLFVQQAQFDVPGLPHAARARSRQTLTRIAQLLDSLAPPDSVNRVTDSLVAFITAAAGGPKVVEPLPNRPPSLERGAVVYRERCAACHGESGRGDGPKAKSVKGPAPANLTDPAVMGNKSLLDIFRRIAVGTPGTAMPEFAEDLSAEDRWAVASYVGAMQYGGSATAAIFAAVRHQIDSALAKRSDKIAVDAYMTFEEVETAIRANNPGLASELEGNFAWLRTRALKADDAERHTIRERLLAAAVLFYVSYWLLSKIEAAKWTAFVHGKMQSALSSGSGAALSAVAFLAVYREGFETILFYKALFTSAGSSGVSVVAGIAAGAVGLVAVYVLINQLGLRVAMKPFFAVTGAMLYYMAFVFAGKGIAELQGT